MKKNVIHATKQTVPHFVYSGFTKQVSEKTPIGRLILNESRKMKI